MPKYCVPVSWIEAGEYYIEANSKEEAIEKAYRLELPQEPRYEGGFEVHEESIEELKDA